MSSSTPAASRLLPWAQLVRLPTVFTVIADVSAAFLFVARGPQPASRFMVVVIAGIFLYWAGMILNDLFDLDQDRRERSNRPLAAGKIPLRQARAAGWGLLLLGAALGIASGMVPAAQIDANWVPGVVAVLLAATIVAYDWPLKRTPFAPAAMGGCRFLSFLLGATAALPPPTDLAGEGLGSVIPRHVLTIAAGFGVYVMGLTSVSRREAVGDRTINLASGAIVTVIGLAILAFAPRVAEERPPWFFDVDRSFPILVFLIAAPVVLRLIRLARDRSPAHIQNAVRAGLLTIIPLAASYALLGAGQAWGIIIFLLVFPSIFLARRFRVT